MSMHIGWLNIFGVDVWGIFPKWMWNKIFCVAWVELFC